MDLTSDTQNTGMYVSESSNDNGMTVTESSNDNGMNIYESSNDHGMTVTVKPPNIVDDLKFIKDDEKINSPTSIGKKIKSLSIEDTSLERILNSFTGEGDKIYARDFKNVPKEDLYDAISKKLTKSSETVVEPEVKLSKSAMKKLTKNNTMYWGAELTNDVFDNIEIKKFLDENPDLIKNVKIHSTLFFVGKKIHPDEDLIRPFEGKECTVTIDAYGHSEKALSLRVTSIQCDGVDVPSFATQQHVTMALQKGTPAKDSVKTLLGEGTVTEFDVLITLTGKVKRYLY
jgi:hypothetical protein